MSGHYNLRDRSKKSPQYKDDTSLTSNDFEFEPDGDGDDSQDENEDELPEDRSKWKVPVSKLNNSSKSTKSKDCYSSSSDSSNSFPDSPASRADNDSTKRLYPQLPTPSPSRSQRQRINLSVQSDLSDANFSSSSGRVHAFKKQSTKNKVEQQKHAVPPKLGLFIMLIVVVYMVIIYRPASETLSASQSHFNSFSEGIDRLSEEFSGQDKRIWKVIKSSVKYNFDSDEPAKPAVLLMVCENDAAPLAESIANAIASEFANAYFRDEMSTDAELTLNFTNLSTDVDDQKLYVDKWLKGKFDSNHNVLVLNHLEALLPQAALLLHGYCDGDNAPYKRVVLILVLYLDHPLNSPRDVDAALRNIWLPAISEDKIGGLLTRIANNVIFVTKNK